MLIKGIDVLEVLFELVLFGLLVVVVYRLVKDYMVPALYSEIEKIKKKRKDIVDKEDLLVDSSKKLVINIKDQEENFVDLDKKVQTWRSSILEEQSKNIKEKELFLNQTKEKRKKQAVNLGLLKLQEKVIPESVKLAYKKIEELYVGQKSINLLKELISAIQPDKK